MCSDWIKPSIFPSENTLSLSDFEGLKYDPNLSFEDDPGSYGINEVDSTSVDPPSLYDASDDNGNAQQWMNTMHDDCLTMLVFE